MKDEKLTLAEQKILLEQARMSMEAGILGQQLPPINLADIPESLSQTGACFVTLTIGGKLRGCIGTLEASQPLIQDVRERAAAAAMDDYRFPAVRQEEFPVIQIEISRLTTPKPLLYTDPDDLVEKLRPNIDGVVLKDGLRRATFLPQVWEKLPQKTDFLNQLCLKMGAPGDLWRQKPIEVLVYQVEEFHE